MSQAAQTATVNYLRPNQVDELEGEVKTAEAALAPENAVFAKNLDRGAMAKQLKNAKTMLHDQSPPEVKKGEADKLVAQERELRETILIGMPSQEEMRKNPPGAVAKHREWERRNKENVQNWKNIKLRMNLGSDDQDIANLEAHRPIRNTLNMDGAQIPGTQHYFPQGQIEVKNVMDIEHKQKQLDAMAERTKFLDEAGQLITDEERAIFGLDPLSDEDKKILKLKKQKADAKN